MAGRRVHFVMDAEFLARIDAALPEGVSRGEFVRRAVEQALEEVNSSRDGRPSTTGLSARNAMSEPIHASPSSGPASGVGVEDVGAESLPAPAEQSPGPVAGESVTPNERATVGGAAGVSSSGRVHLPTCRCPVCS